MTCKKRFKLYKSGKKWCVMAIAVVAMAFGMANMQSVNADDSTNIEPATIRLSNESNNGSAVNVVSDKKNNQTTSTNEDTTQKQTATTSTSSNSSTQDDNINTSTSDEQINQVNGGKQNAGQQVTNANTEPTQNSSNEAAQPNTASATTDSASTATTQVKLAAANTEKNGWVPENNHLTYYDHGNIKEGRSYSYLPTINGQGYSWYLVDNGVVQSGVQKWAGTYYYFDPTTHLRVDNNYVQSQWGMWYMFGPDGRIATRVYQWAGTYYYFDPVTYLRVDNDYRQSQWGMWYMFGHDGRIATKVYQWANSYYYFDPVTYLRVDNDYRQSQWGDWYMFGPDGRIQTGAHRWMGSIYYFDPITYLRVDNGWREGFYFGADGRLVNGGFSTGVINWFLKREGHLTYSMYGSRTGADGTADCSGSMTAALWSAGASRPAFIYSTETLHGYLLNNGYYLAYEGNGPVDLHYGDIIIWGRKGYSYGGAGHTMVATGSGDNQTVISTCYLTGGAAGTAVQEVYYKNYWMDDGQPYQYVYRLSNPARN